MKISQLKKLIREAVREELEEFKTEILSELKVPTKPSTKTLLEQFSSKPKVEDGFKVIGKTETGEKFVSGKNILEFFKNEEKTKGKLLSENDKTSKELEDYVKGVMGKKNVTIKI